MSRKLTFDQAAKIMRAAKLEPLEEYPGNKLPWKCRCLLCGNIVYPQLGAVRNNGGGCRPCGLKRSAGSRRTGEEEAVQFMKKAGAIPLEPYQNSKAPWLCRCIKCEREIRPAYGNVKNNGTHPCVYCSKKKTHPDDAILIMNKAGLEPLEPYPGSRVNWKCKHTKCGEIVSPTLDSIIQGQGGCLKCGYAETKRKQLTDSDEAIAFFRSKGFDPLEEYPGSTRPWRSKCLKCGFIVSPYFGRVKDGSGCGVCSKKIVVPEEAVKVMLNARLNPLEPFPGSKNPWRCKCLRCGEEVTPVYGNVNQGDGGCKHCGGHYVSPEAAIALMLAANIKPLEPYKNSGTRWKSQCLVCKKDISPTYNSVQQRGRACKYCAKIFVDADDAIRIMRNAKLEPLVPYPGSQKPWHCKCLRCGKEVQPAYTAIQGGQKGCVYCGGKKVDPDEAFRLMLSAGLTPLEVYERADKPWNCTCNKCKKLVTPTYTSIRVGQGGCRYCTNKGLDYNSPTFLYLMTHHEFGAHKIGVGNHKTRNNRITEHKKTGWVLIQSMDFSTGDLAFQVEQETLVWLRQVKKLGIFLSKAEMPQGGETETVDASEIDLPTIWEKVEELSKIKK